MPAQRYVAVISDLHMSEGALEDFDAELEGYLLGVLDWLGALEEPAELVINGDFLDFVQASPWRGAELEASTTENIPLCFAEHHSIDKLHAIYRAHQPVFAALRQFLAKNQNNRITVLPGNHDADFFWPNVAEEFTQMACPEGHQEQVQVVLSDSYRPDLRTKSVGTKVTQEEYAELERTAPFAEHNPLRSLVKSQTTTHGAWPRA